MKDRLKVELTVIDRLLECKDKDNDLSLGQVDQDGGELCVGLDAFESAYSRIILVLEERFRLVLLNGHRRVLLAFDHELAQLLVDVAEGNFELRQEDFVVYAVSDDA